jgi:hypothetical protein
MNSGMVNLFHNNSSSKSNNSLPTPQNSEKYNVPQLIESLLNIQKVIKYY